MEPSAADEDLTVTNVHSGEEYVSENPLDNATEINENGQNIAYSENTIIEPDVNTGGGGCQRNRNSLDQRQTTAKRKTFWEIN